MVHIMNSLHLHCKYKIYLYNYKIYIFIYVYIYIYTYIYVYIYILNNFIVKFFFLGSLKTQKDNFLWEIDELIASDALNK